MMQIKIVPNEKGNPPGKLADAELHFTDITIPCPTCHGRATFECDSCGTTGTIDLPNPLADLKLIGFGIWESRDHRRNVTFPARQYAVNGERRSFALLRPIADFDANHRLRQAILDAYAQYEAADATPSTDPLTSDSIKF